MIIITQVHGMSSVKFYETIYTWYFQNAGWWAKVSYWDGTIASDGCGPTSIATIYSGYWGTLNPNDVIWEYQGVLGLKPGDEYNKPYYNKLELLMHHLGISTYFQNMNGEDMTSYIKSWNFRPILVCVGPGIYTRGGHYMALIGANNDSFFVANPNYKTPGGWQSISSVTECKVRTIKCWAKWN